MDITETTTENKEKKRRKISIRTILLFLIVCAAIACLLYATTEWRFALSKSIQLRKDIANYYDETEPIRQQAQEVLREYVPDPDAEPELLDIPYAELRRVMERYNRSIYINNQAELSSKEAYSEDGDGLTLTKYGLNSNVFAIMRIPKIELEMPVYLGANYQNLADGAAVLAQTSIPIGGINTNSVISGHRGWNGYPYFMRIEEIEVGDYLYIDNPWETLVYQAVEIKIIVPNDIDSILIQPGRDLVTLLTCHPPNTGGRYRYLVFCERVLSDSPEDSLVPGAGIIATPEPTETPST